MGTLVHLERERRDLMSKERDRAQRGPRLSWYLTYKEVGLENISWTKGTQGSMGCRSSFHGHYLLGRGQEWTQASQEIPLVSLTAIEPGEGEMEKQRL